VFAGAHLTDIVVLVVSADDSIMPQTLEAIRLIQHANVPLVVAVNKCDMFMHNFKQVKQDLLKVLFASFISICLRFISNLC
jgi:translation initiation factor IF-2